MTLLSRNDLPAVLAACAVLVASVLVATVLIAGPQSPVTPVTPVPPVPPVTPATPAPSVPPDAPRISVEPPSFDFGKVLPGKSMSREFALRNFGKQELHVDSVTTSCGCTVTDPPPPVKMTLKPGASQPLRVTLTTPDKPGPISKSVLVKSNDPERPTLEIKLQATVVAEAP